MKKVIIIGAGAGGLSAAAHLARRGFQVTILEKNPDVGGRCSQLVRDSHRFDEGPTLFVMPELYAQEFAELGLAMNHALDLQRVDPTYHLTFHDGRRLELTSDLVHMRPQLEAFEPGSYQAFQRYLEEGRRHYELAVPRLVRRNFRHLSQFINPANLVLFLRLHALTPHFAHVQRFFDDPHLQAAFTFQDMYMGLSPFEAPALFSMMQFTELAHGVWYPRGGMHAVVEALWGIAERSGVECRLSTPVERIVTCDTVASGVLLADGSLVEADVILANADLPYVYASLLKEDRAAERLLRRQYSCSTINFLWGLDRTIAPLPAHSLFLGDDYRGNFEAIVRDHSLAADPTVYVHAPARLDPAAAPAGQDTLIGIVPVGHMCRLAKQDWGDLRARARAALMDKLARAGVADLEAHIKFEICFTPPYWQQRFNLVNGSTHGLAHALTQMGYFRPHNRRDRLHNLYFAGASTHPGTGLPTAIVSGRLAAERIAEDIPLD